MKILIDLSWLRPQAAEAGRQALEACLPLIRSGEEKEFVLLLSEGTPEPIAEKNVRIARASRRDAAAAVRKENADWNLFPLAPAPRAVSGEKAVSLLWTLEPDAALGIGASEWRKCLRHAAHGHRHVVAFSEEVQSALIEKYRRGDAKLTDEAGFAAAFAELTAPKKLLFVHHARLGHGSGGSKRTEQNYIGIRANCACDNYRISFDDRRIPRMLGHMLLTRCDLLCVGDSARVARCIRRNGCNTVFLDASIYGKVAARIRKEFPNIRLIVHYHNFEKRYFEDQMNLPKAGGRLRGTLIKMIQRLQYGVVVRNERIATQTADAHVFISDADRENVFAEYGARGEDARVIPPALEDAFTEAPDPAPEAPYVLFLGSSFYANEEAARFLIERIAPKVSAKVVIAGSGMKQAFPGSYENVEVHGFVPSLTELMRGASAFVSPVFSGSGSKIKITEALMNGKYIVGTPDSFVGYDVEGAAVRVCETAEEFIAAINALDHGTRFYPVNRELYLNRYSMARSVEAYAFLREKQCAMEQPHE